MKSIPRKQAEERLKYLNEQLAHDGYWDGWSLQGMKEEKKWLEQELKKLDKQEK